MDNNKGFTLIELVVVIAVIGVIAGAVLLTINPTSVMAKGRDAKRLQDITGMVKALQLGIAEGEITLVATESPSACTTCSSLSGTQAVDGTGYVKYTVPSGKTGLSRYLAVLPKDPLNTGTNVYRFISIAGTAPAFEINVPLESSDNTTKMTEDGGSSTTLFEMGTKLNIP